jgi:DNA-binding CsgD family transcriptional regulator
VSTPAPARLGQPLTDREVQVLRAAANGLPNAQIGTHLFLTTDTVKSHLARTYKKLGARDRAHAVALGLQQGVLTLRDVRPTIGPPPPVQGAPAAVQRTRHLLADWRRSGPPPRAHLIAHWWDHKLTQLATAIQDPKEPTP